MINNTDINKIVVSNKLTFGKQEFKYFIDYKDSEKLDFYAGSVHKWLYTREILMKIDIIIIYLFIYFQKKKKFLLNIWKKVRDIMKI